MRKIKSFSHLLLCNQITGSIILFIYRKRIPDIRWTQFTFFANPKHVSKRMISSIFWGFYESSEIRFIEKYLDPTLSVIELGASIGIVSSHIAAKIQPLSKHIMVEANPYLIDNILENVQRNKRDGVDFKIINKAICYTSEKVQLNITNNNTGTKIMNDENSVSGLVSVQTTTLSSIISEFSLNEFSIVSDIEGSEIEFLLQEDDSLKNCRQLLIELHDTKHVNISYSIKDMVEIICRTHKFQLIAFHGPVYFFSK